MTSTLIHVVDHDELARKGAARLLDAAGFEVRTYATAEDFLSAVDPDAPGCISLDMRLPGRSGLEIQVALAERAINLPIVFVTGHGQIPDTVPRHCVVLVDEGMAKTATTKTLKDDIYAFVYGQKGLMAGLGIQGNKIKKIQPK